MDNPWRKLPETSPYLLPSDRDAILAYNAKARQEHFVHHELLPEPYLGNIDADIVLLNLNPGYSGEDASFQADPIFQDLCRKNLLHELSDHPFYLLSPALDATKDGAAWWSRKLKVPIQRSSRKRVANCFLCVEYFPYHSRRYKRANKLLPSQHYGFYLVRRAIKRGAMIILMRSRKLWMEAIPQLREYGNLFELRNPQNPAISPRNCPDGFSLIMDVLQGA